MGQASRKGTFEERKAKAVERNRIATLEINEALEKKDSEMSQEEKNKQVCDRLTMLSFAAAFRRSGLSQKEFRRRVTRYKKKGR